MLNVFKKNNRENGKNQSKETKILSAKEALNLAEQKWLTLQEDKIFQEIQSRAKYGFRTVYFYASYITGAQMNKLKDLGYEVEISQPNGCAPYVKVSW